MSSIPESVKLGNDVVIEERVSLGENVQIGHHTVLLAGTKIGDDVTIGSNCVLGIRPSVNKQMRKVSTSDHGLFIQSGTRIGHLVSIYANTQIGKNVFVGDHASIRERVSIDDETVIGRAAMIEVNTTIGTSCTIQTQAYVTGDSTLEDYVFIGPCVSMSNDKYMGAQPYALQGPYIKSSAKVGNSASLLPGVVIGNKAVIGAGSVVTKNIDDHVVAAGVPAKEM